jgi:hypothetical protein
MAPSSKRETSSVVAETIIHTSTKWSGCSRSCSAPDCGGNIARSTPPRLPALSRSRISNSLLNAHVLSQVLELMVINIQEILLLATTGQCSGFRTIVVRSILSDIYRLQHCLNLWCSEVKQAPFGSPHAAPVHIERCAAVIFQHLMQHDCLWPLEDF